MLENSNFDKFPEVFVSAQDGVEGWPAIQSVLQKRVLAQKKPGYVVVVECYHGVFGEEVSSSLLKAFPAARLIRTQDYMLDAACVQTKTYPFVTDDPVFGFITTLELEDFFDREKLKGAREMVATSNEELTIVCGAGASLFCSDPDLLVYADMPRWEIQLRFRRNEVSNLGLNNARAAFAEQYKRGFFVDWRVCDKQKTKLMDRWDFVLDTTIAGQPKMISGELLRQGLETAVKQPFRVVPFFDPGPWGGQWLKEVCDLERSEKNFAWGFDCVPEENSLLLRYGSTLFETPSINLVFARPQELLGEKVYEAFGAEFPIRFDFLDTMEGGNLSLQVHPLKQYIREKFGMPYTQDESYYFLQAKEDAFVYLGLKEGVVPEAMLGDLEKAQEGKGFDAEQYVEKWPVKKHDHVLIPAGTVHCSGANSVVLEISATPYIFTFKLWDWGRMGLDGKPRPISLAHGREVIQWDRTSGWTKEHLLNRFETVAVTDGWREEKTGLDPTSFIETRRHWFTGTVPHDTQGVVNVLNLIEGKEAVVESPTGAFEPFVVHYAETFIVPAAVGAYTVRPYGASENEGCATIKAYVRTENLDQQYRNN